MSVTEVFKISVGKNGSQEHFFSRDPNVKSVYQEAKRFAPSNAPIFITGETGSGKDVLARFIHENSAVRDEKFIALNCAAIPEALAESKLFGHKKGSFTGASRDEPGIFRAVDGGTVFLDEVGELSLATQAKLLKVIEDKEVMPVGSSSTQPANFRLLSATHRDLDLMVEEGKFRRDLLYRIKVLDLRLPSLNERRADIPLIAIKLLEHHQKQNPPQGDNHSFSSEALTALTHHDWSGNIRHLSNVVLSGLIRSNSAIITLADLKLPNPASSKALSTTYFAAAGIDIPNLDEDDIGKISDIYASANDHDISPNNVILLDNTTSNTQAPTDPKAWEAIGIILSADLTAEEFKIFLAKVSHELKTHGNAAYKAFQLTPRTFHLWINTQLNDAQQAKIDALKSNFETLVSSGQTFYQLRKSFCEYAMQVHESYSKTATAIQITTKTLKKWLESSERPTRDKSNSNPSGKNDYNHLQIEPD